MNTVSNFTELQLNLMQQEDSSTQGNDLEWMKKVIISTYLVQHIIFYLLIPCLFFKVLAVSFSLRSQIFFSTKANSKSMRSLSPSMPQEYWWGRFSAATCLKNFQKSKILARKPFRKFIIYAQIVTILASLIFTYACVYIKDQTT